jgi:tRNA-intron endonuclease
MSSPTSPASSQPLSDSINSKVDIPLIEAFITSNGKIVVEDIRFQDLLRTKGFGEKQETEYILTSYEALYLSYTKQLVFKNQTEMSFNLLFELLLKVDKNIMTKFLVFRDLRSRGYIAKEGFGFGNDFRVYERGEYEKKPAKYVIFGVNEGTDTTAKNLAIAIEEIEKMGKEAVIAVIERRGEVIYYKVSKMRFLENKYHHQKQSL